MDNNKIPIGSLPQKIRLKFHKIFCSRNSTPGPIPLSCPETSNSSQTLFLSVRSHPAHFLDPQILCSHFHHHVRSHHQLQPGQQQICRGRSLLCQLVWVPGDGYSDPNPVPCHSEIVRELE
uniref:Uncharacterized protein n=1 Tax=Cacopsylla melanoneura TaxID=428564 RepID=A0A8D8ZAP8_9HEMI